MGNNNKTNSLQHNNKNHHLKMMNYFAIAALAIAGASARGLQAVQQDITEAGSPGIELTPAYNSD